jgi:parallel beta-helix repeat protein
MSEFTKTIIVDSSLATETPGQYRKTIKAAVDDLITAGVGGVVIVEAGTYDIDDTGNQKTIDIPDNCAIIGQGDVIINVTVNTPVFKNTGFGTNAHSRITISGFKININVSSDVYHNNVIHLKGVKNSILEKLTITANTGAVYEGYSAIVLEGFYRSENGIDYPCSGNVISQCFIGQSNINSQFTNGIYLKGYDASHLDCQANMITDNIIYNCANAIFLEYAPFNKIQGNILSLSSSIGLKVLYSDFNVIDGGIFLTNSSDGILVDQSSNCAIAGNKCHNNTGCGIHLHGESTASLQAKYHSISGNSCSNDSGQHNGIYLEDYSIFNTINGNSCHDSNGIIEDPHTEGAENNLVVGNVCYGGTPIDLGDETNSIQANNKTN